MNQTAFQNSSSNDKFVAFPDDVIRKEVALLYQFAEKSLESYQSELYEYLFPVFLETAIIFLKKTPNNNTEALRFLSKYGSYHYAFHEDLMESIRNVIERSNPQLNFVELPKYYQMTVTMRKSTKKLLTSLIVGNNLQFIPELENQYITFNVIDDSKDDVEFQRVRLLNLIQNQEAKCKVAYVEKYTKSEDTTNYSRLPHRFPSIAVASFNTRFDSHIICIRISRDGKNFAVSTENGLVHLWNENNEKKITHHLLLGHTENVMDMDFSADGRYLLTGSLDGSVRMWLTQEGRCIVNYRTYGLPVWFVRFNPKNRLILVAYYNSLVQLFNTDDIQEVYHNTISFGDITALTWSLHSSCYFVGYSNGNIFVFTAEKGLHRLLLGEGSPVTAIACMPKSNNIIAGYENGTLTVFNILDCHQVATVKGHDKVIRKILCNSDKNTITTLGEDGCVKFWEIRTINQENTKSDALGFYSFHGAPQPQQTSKTVHSLYMLHNYPIEGMEFIDGVMIKENVMVVAGVSNSKKICIVCETKLPKNYVKNPISPTIHSPAFGHTQKHEYFLDELLLYVWEITFSIQKP